MGNCKEVWDAIAELKTHVNDYSEETCRLFHKLEDAFCEFEMSWEEHADTHNKGE